MAKIPVTLDSTSENSGIKAQVNQIDATEKDQQAVEDSNDAVRSTQNLEKSQDNVFKSNQPIQVLSIDVECVATGYSHSFGDEFMGIDLDDVQFIPLAASGRLALGDSFGLGADVGYALGVNDGNDGGFYYAPRVSYGISDAIDIVAAYRGVSKDGSSWDIISLGVEFGL